ncbi:hypothetical protein ARMSODRAFT_955597 [Armillaria solidipes]|uniref:Uncharacterized protein n=1 Tax=Armillaria solidipes TaxID=1076256 RepID=A0A2H3BJ43_9AGAR|nr:hypothetical protein ARMSODRAFT_955597 [Armillaria solidipes]
MYKIIKDIINRFHLISGDQVQSVILLLATSRARVKLQGSRETVTSLESTQLPIHALSRSCTISFMHQCHFPLPTFSDLPLDMPSALSTND